LALALNLGFEDEPKFCFICDLFSMSVNPFACVLPYQICNLFACYWIKAIF